jgi:4-amino-4-deoxy-L-arabinose transferase-like glycosyltransferase
LGLLGLGFSAAQIVRVQILTGIQLGLTAYFILSNDSDELKSDLKTLAANLNLSFSQYSLFAKLAIILPLLFSFLLTLVPPFEAFDALLYHLAQPARVLQDGGLRPVDNPAFWFPNITENVYLWALAFGSERAPQTIHFAWGTLSVLLLWHWAVRTWSIEIGRKTLLLLAAIPSLPMLASWAYADMALIFYAIATFYALTRFESIKSLPWLRLAGVMAGLAMSVKYTSFTVPLTSGLLILYWRRKSFSQALIYAAQFSLIALTVASAWYVRNAIIMGNPFYPFVFGGRYWDSFRADWYAGASTGIGWDVLQFVSLPLTVILGFRDQTYFDGRIGPLFFLLAPFALWILLSRAHQDSDRSLSLQAIGVFAALSFAAWTLGVINSIGLWQARLLFPALISFAIPTALSWDTLKEFDTSKLRISFLINTVIVVVITLTIFDNALFILQRNPLAVALGAQTRERYIERVNPSYAALMQMMDELPFDAHIYSLFEPRSYGLPRRTQADPINYNFAHDLHLYELSSEIIQQWKMKGYTHILVYERGLNFLADESPNLFTSSMQNAVLETLGQLKLINQTPDKVYTIYQIP